MAETLAFAFVVIGMGNAKVKPDDPILIVKSSTIAETKANGKAWDFAPGKKAWPDPYVKVWVYDDHGSQSDYGETGVADDTFTPVWNKDVVTVRSGQKIAIEVWDKDVKYDDLIGRHELILANDLVKKRNLVLRFAQVKEIRLELRPGTRLTEHSRILLLQAFPGPRSARELMRSTSRTHAVVLLHGLDLRDDGSSALKPRIQDWQGSRSCLTQTLSKHFDVFSLSYSQTTPVELVSTFAELRDAIQKVKQLGYDNVTLLGHSAGGLVARHLVEEHPGIGVTKVIQIATPNAGSSLAGWGVTLGQVPQEQEAFVKSLSTEYREVLMKRRQGKGIAPTIDFVTVVVTAAPRKNGDGSVARRSQWPWDLQQQGIPYIDLQATHGDVLAHDACLDALCALVMQPHTRWDEVTLRKMRQAFLSAPK